MKKRILSSLMAIVICMLSMGMVSVSAYQENIIDIDAPLDDVSELTWVASSAVTVSNADEIGGRDNVLKVEGLKNSNNNTAGIVLGNDISFKPGDVLVYSLDVYSEAEINPDLWLRNHSASSLNPFVQFAHIPIASNTWTTVERTITYDDMVYASINGGSTGTFDTPGKYALYIRPRNDATVYLDNFRITVNHEHSYGNWETDGDIYHKKICGCGDVLEREEHIWNSGEITITPTQNTNGIRTYTCTQCGETKTEEIESIVYIDSYLDDASELTWVASDAVTVSEVSNIGYVYNALKVEGLADSNNNTAGVILGENILFKEGDVLTYSIDIYSETAINPDIWIRNHKDNTFAPFAQFYHTPIKANTWTTITNTVTYDDMVRISLEGGSTGEFTKAGKYALYIRPRSNATVYLDNFRVSIVRKADPNNPDESEPDTKSFKIEGFLDQGTTVREKTLDYTLTNGTFRVGFAELKEYSNGQNLQHNSYVRVVPYEPLDYEKNFRITFDVTTSGLDVSSFNGGARLFDTTTGKFLPNTIGLLEQATIPANTTTTVSVTKADFAELGSVSAENGVASFGIYLNLQNAADNYSNSGDYLEISNINVEYIEETEDTEAPTEIEVVGYFPQGESSYGSVLNYTLVDGTFSVNFKELRKYSNGNNINGHSFVRIVPNKPIDTNKNFKVSFDVEMEGIPTNKYLYGGIRVIDSTGYNNAIGWISHNIELKDNAAHCMYTNIGGWNDYGNSSSTYAKSIGIYINLQDYLDYCPDDTCIKISNVEFAYVDLDAPAAEPGDTSIYSYTIEDGKVTITGCDADLFGHLTVPSTIEGYPVTTIAQKAFYQCEGLTEITIPEGVTTIENWAFVYCRSLKRLNLPASLIKITGATFAGGGSSNSRGPLSEINIDVNNPNYVTVDGDLFSKDMKTLVAYAIGKSDIFYVIPDGVTTIDKDAFNHAYNLTSVTIPDSVTNIGWEAFCFCTNLKNVTIPDSVTTIGGWAFGICVNLESINIPASVTSIGDAAFAKCTSLNNIDIDPDNQNYIMDNGVMFNKDKTRILGYLATKDDTSYDIPDSVTTIGTAAFHTCKKLTQIKIPDSVKSLTTMAFFQCSGLTSMVIPDGVTYIGSRAFVGCTSLSSIVIPNSVKTIITEAFGDCKALSSVYFMGTESEWNEIEIGEDNECLTNATIHFLGSSSEKPEQPPVEYPEDCTSVTVSDTKAMAGCEITVPVSVSNNTIGLTGLTLNITYDTDVFSYIDANQGEALPTLSLTKPGEAFTEGDLTFIWDAMDADFTNGDLLYITFEVADTAAIRDHEIKVTVVTACDQEMEDVLVKANDGTINVIKYTSGDPNGDSTIDVKDVISVRRYITSGYGLSIFVRAADLNKDNRLDVKDIITLRRYIAGGYGIEL